MVLRHRFKFELLLLAALKVPFKRPDTNCSLVVIQARHIGRQVVYEEEGCGAGGGGGW